MFRDFTSDDWELFAGCESSNPQIAEAPTTVDNADTDHGDRVSYVWVIDEIENDSAFLHVARNDGEWNATIALPTTECARVLGEHLIGRMAIYFDSDTYQQHLEQFGFHD